MTAEQSIVSIGKLAERICAPVARIAKAAEAAHVVPALAINGVPYFREADCDRIDEQLRSGPRPHHPLAPPKGRRR